MQRWTPIILIGLLAMAACDQPDTTQEPEEIPDRFVEVSEEESAAGSDSPAVNEPNVEMEEQPTGIADGEDGPVGDAKNAAVDLALRKSADQKRDGKDGAASDRAGKKSEKKRKVKPKMKRASGKLEAKMGVAMSGEATGFGGLGMKGTGKGGGAVGSSRVHAIGNLRGTRGGSGYGRGAANLGGKAVAPNIRTGSANVRGRAGFMGRARGPGAPRPEPRRNTEEYTDHGVNKFVDVSEDALSTFAVDVDTGSYTIARRKLQSGTLPPQASVRVEEFVNYFDYDYAGPKSGPFAVHMEAAPTPLAGVSDRYLLRVGVQGKTIPESERKPVHLTFLVDVSGSMRSADKIGLVKRSLRILTNNLRENDTVAIATYAGNTRKVLEPTSAAQRGEIMGAIDSLNAGGSTAMADGLTLAYGMALENLNDAHESRVIVLSDGDANVGTATHGGILKRIRGYVKKGVTMSTIGFGMGNYRDTLMEQLANNGNGNYYYIDSDKEAEKVFGEQLDGTLQVIAKDVKIQVDFDDKAVRRYRLVGYENRDVADKDFRNDKVDAGEIGAGHTVTAIYELELAAPVGNDLPETLATVRVRHKKPKGKKAEEQAFPLRRAMLKTKLSQASKDYQFAAAVTAFAEKLRKSPYAGKVSWELVLEVAKSSTKGRSQRKELVDLVERAQKLSRS